MKQILVIDDDVQISGLLNEILRRAGYAVLHAYSGTEALLLLEKECPDLVLLDLMLPGLSGEEVLPKIRELPVIVISAKVDVQDKVNLLLGGAADYMTKSFDTKELLARIEVQLRGSQKERLSPVYACGDLSLDTVSHGVTAGGTPVLLTKTEYAILKLLMQNPSQVIAKSVILEKIRLDTPDCTERSLKQHVSNLRKKLHDAAGKDYIEAAWGIGFKMVNENPD